MVSHSLDYLLLSIMKKLFSILLVCLILVVLALVAGYFVVTSASFQKRMLESKLPAGSSVKHVHVTSGTLKLSELILVLEDGTRVKVSEVDTTFSPLAALFDNTIRMGDLEIDGLLVQLPQAAPMTQPGVSSSQSTSSTSSTVSSSSTSAPATTNPWDAINQIENIEWLLDIETIKFNGKIKDADGNTYAFDVKSGAIRPSAETIVDASLNLVSSEPIQSGIKELDAKAQLRFKQKATGGFEQLSYESQTTAKDAAGREILAVSNALQLTFNGFEETAEVSLKFSADVQRPELLMSELATMGTLKASGNLKAKVEGAVTTLTSADLNLSANGLQVVELDLKKPLNLGGKQNLSGELLQLKISELPLTWLGPWMPEGMSIEGAPLNAQFVVNGQTDGTMEVSALAPIQVGPISVINAGQALLQEATIEVDPVIRINPDQSIDYDLKSFRLIDRYGEVLSGQLKGQSDLQSMGGANPLAGQIADLKLSIDLQPFFQQPLLNGKASVIGGKMDVSLKVDGGHETPVQMQGAIRGLRASSMHNAARDFRFATQLQNLGVGEWGFKLNLDAGPESRPSTDMHAAGRIHTEGTPLKFKVELKGEQLTQSDIDLLMAAFTPRESKPTVVVNPYTGVPINSSGTKPVVTEKPLSKSNDAVMPPPWSDLQGEASVQYGRVVLNSGQTIEDVYAQALITEPQLTVSGLRAQMGGGSLAGEAQVDFDRKKLDPYALLVNFDFSKIDPSIFSDKRSGSFPVKGLFDGKFQLTGKGASLEDAADKSVGDLMITGTNGVLTAFELDDRGQRGLGIVGILGQQFGQPGIAALAETVPYFKDIRFNDFVLELKRTADRRVLIPQLKLTGESLLINGSGSIAAGSFKDVLKQPLDLVLELGAKGRLTGYLETLQLLKPTTAEDGFRRWSNSVHITGSLDKPNTSAIMDLLSKAASAVFDKPKKNSSQPAPDAAQVEGQQAETLQPDAQAEPKKKTKEEKRRDDIEMGLDLLNSVFGQ